MKNSLINVNILNTGSLKSFLIHYGLLGGGGGEFLKHIVTCLFSLNIIKLAFFSDLQKNVSYTESHKKFLMYYGLYLKTAKNVF